METGRITFKVADIVFEVSSDRPMALFHREEVYQDFVCCEAPDVTIHARYSGLPQVPLLEGDRTFDSEGVWSLYQSGDQNVFALRSPVFEAQPYCIAVFDADFEHGQIHACSSEFAETADDDLPNPLAFPMSEVLMVCLLAQGRGLMVHACGVDDGGRGYLLAGNSTHGKTTMAGLWKDRATILNDDRIVLRRHEGNLWMYGTPWHGEYTAASSRRVPLERIFFLNHAEANGALRMEDADAVSMLLARSFLPLWDEEGMRSALDFCAQLVAEVTCYKLGFVPDGSIIDFVRSIE